MTLEELEYHKVLDIWPVEERRLVWMSQVLKQEVDLHQQLFWTGLCLLQINAPLAHSRSVSVQLGQQFDISISQDVFGHIGPVQAQQKAREQISLSQILWDW